MVISGNRAALSGPLRVVAQSAGPADAQVTVLVAQQVSDVVHTVTALRTALWIAAPLLLALLAVIAWYVIGWTLRPVETLRESAERISGTGHSERLPVPEAADEIAALAITLNKMLDRLSAARGRQRAFVADAAHELRSPLASIRVQLEVAQRIGDGGALVEDLLIDVDRLVALVEDLLLLARADADTRRPAHAETFDGQALLQDLASARPTTLIPVRVEPGPTVLVIADPAEMRRAIGNLLDNAQRYATSVVTVRVTDDRNHTTFAVDDDGPGIEAADRDAVFQRFTRLDDARDRDAGGSGLGLPIVRELAHRAGGTVTLCDGPDERGLSARITIPSRTSGGQSS